jgi:ribosome biogenesis GTPase
MAVRHGLILSIEGPWCRVEADGCLFRCSLRKKLFLQADGHSSPVAVGDEVILQETSPGEGTIERVLERRTKLSRLAPWAPEKEHVVAVNIDQLLIVVAIKDPPLKEGIVDRYIMVAESGGLKPIICINKTDLARDGETSSIEELYGGLGYSLLFTSAVQGRGIDQLKELLRGKKTVFGGPSGVGKSSLINALQPGLGLKVREIRQVARKGRHTTSWVNLIKLGMGGHVVDTPGVRELGLWNIKAEEVSEFFPEIWEIGRNCKYTRCTHSHEPNCAVKEAVKSGTLAEKRYGSYLRIFNSIEKN